MKKTFITIFALAALSTSCTKDFVKTNTNPNTFDEGDVMAYNLFEGMEYETFRVNQNYCYYYVNELMQMSAMTSNITNSIFQYNFLPSNSQSFWDTYARLGFDCQHIIEVAKENGDDYLVALGHIFKVYNLYSLTSIFGDIPYCEAYQGKNKILTPKFDAQDEVIEQMLSELEEANQILAENPDPYKPGQDVVFYDSCIKWRKLANSLKIRLLTHLTNQSDSYWDRIQEIINNPTDYPVMESSDDSAIMHFPGTPFYKSYWGEQVFLRKTFVLRRACKTLVEMFLSRDTSGDVVYEDPRIRIYCEMNGTKWKGATSGCLDQLRDVEDTDAAYPNATTLCTDTTPGFMMDYSELMFIYAEGALKGKLKIPGKTYAECYEAAVLATMTKWCDIYNSAMGASYDAKTLTDKLLTTKLAKLDDAGSVNCPYKSKEEMIAAQKYLSLYYTGWEQYNEWRRTEYPILTVGDGCSYNDWELPTRLVYPNYTRSNNAKNVNAALQRMGGSDDMHTPLDFSYRATHGSHRNPHPNSRY